KRTAELIPLCHSLPLDQVSLEFTLETDRILITADVSLTARTGAEMEALTAVAVAGLAIYDMCKALDRTMVVGEIRLLEKRGGRSGHFRRADA
ncbi:MAG: cyclic pyranopterin monophosphate synthase MoaC, partial [Candidatus Eisenbacteria bacterium]|nr:cyclic pyranopterin monophosphate synthase MoaC [Candidatus Eisenbacteria bacterium]